MKPTLSVAMPNYNHAAYLPRAIEGVLNQTRPPDEFLILDDASTDDSVEIIESYARKNPIIQFVRGERNVGVIEAHERLYRMAQGDYLYSAAADDDRAPNFFELAMEMAERYGEAGLIFGKMVIVDDQGVEVGETEARRWQEPVFAPPEVYLRDFLEVEPPMQTMTGATVFKRSAFEEVGWCRPELGSFADTFAARAIALKYGACYVPAKFHVWHRRLDSFSQQTNSDAKRGLEIVALAERLMRSDEFAARFPADYVTRWARRQRRQTVWTYLLDAGYSGEPSTSFFRRNLRRLRAIPHAAALLSYKGNS